MEPSESIVESYMRAVLKCFTISNIKLRQNKEIDLLAIDPKGQKYHVECSVKTTPAFSGIHAMPRQESKHKAKWRMSLYFFESEKFNHPIVKEAMKEYGFKDNNYKKVIVASNVKEGVREIATEKGVEIWLFNDIIEKLMEIADRAQYLSGDERMFQLIARWLRSKQGKQGIGAPRTRRLPKYQPLYDYLKHISSVANEVTLTFGDIESILGNMLPKSARTYPAWWANETSGPHVQAPAWMDAGWEVDKVSLSEGWVRFVRAR